MICCFPTKHWDVTCLSRSISCIHIWISFQTILVQLAMSMVRGFIKIYQAWRSGTKVNGVPVCLLTTARHSRGMNDEKEQTLDSSQFQPHPNRESGTSIFSFSGTTPLVSYVPKKKKKKKENR
ncbi:hypothetical protein LAZ67_15000966 [Cordylochernes scorpioides]|uniref:Uncharacterized protein n=1 Tax=Cordylochernes scorpioides TaxID=51811 RepID=A0ABY6L8P9_9ARAC|nr:hypothetical protein LAZ67_15000966 [Cordylochernes scorpioides]